MATHGLPAWPWAGTETADLPPAESLLLEAIRRWAGAAREGAPARAACRLPLIAEDAGAAALPLDGLLHAVAAAGRGGGLPPIGCPLCPCVTPAEADLLLAAALAQRGCRAQALGLLLRHLPLAAAAAAVPQAMLLGARLRTAGLVLRNPLR
ncbi:hypothetical protein ACFQY5_32190 [Paeniroseomonas aquatica]|uniref:Uncharacterized protein n=1 Tax=Paeniroseomonas aquatica TaxID=373043 RepID=A0ABT8A6T7_9PROT|nr:hypothetical protein [Paeniroseomonas aquatica]MDN3565508.1 hypothetical protein [Paeniroseomonas aquatica]